MITNEQRKEFFMWLQGQLSLGFRLGIDYRETAGFFDWASEYDIEQMIGELVELGKIKTIRRFGSYVDDKGKYHEIVLHEIISVPQKESLDGF